MTDKSLEAELGLPAEKPKAKTEAKPEKVEAPAKKTELREQDDDGIVRDPSGIPLFKRMKPTRETTNGGPKKRPVAPTKVRDRVRVHDALHNASLLDFPSDRWGITKDLRKAMTHVASRIAGDQAKKDLVDKTLTLLIKHMQAKFEMDKAYRDEKIAEYQAKNEAEAAE